MFFETCDENYLTLKGEYTFYTTNNKIKVKEVNFNKKYLIYNSLKAKDKSLEGTIVDLIYQETYTLIVYIDRKLSYAFIKVKELSMEPDKVVTYVENRIKGKSSVKVKRDKFFFEFNLESKEKINKISLLCGNNDFKTYGKKLTSKIKKIDKGWKVTCAFEIFADEIYRKFLNDSIVNNYFFIEIDYGELIVVQRAFSNFSNIKIRKENYYYATKAIKVKNSESEIFIRLSNRGQNTAVVTNKVKKTIALKRLMASFIVKLLYNNKQNINDIYFEKFSKKAGESALQLFEYSKTKNIENSYFIMDKEESNYNILKNKYGKHILEKNTIRSNVKILCARSLISSELPQHILKRLYDNDRVLRKKIANCNNKIFLQHGVSLATDIFARKLFDKSVESSFNYAVCSSETERALILKKTKYTSDELIYTGLPNLDVFIDHRNKTVERKLITFFLTWRLWDTNGEIKPGSYLKRYIDFFELIKTDSFYKGKEIRVILHPKAREILLEQFPDEYSKIKDTVYEGNIKSALLDTKVFITDYSSSVFFAYAAGAYPVFYWEDKEVAEYHYKSPNFLQENNVFGPVAYNYECLNDLIKTEYNKDGLSPLDEKYLYFVDRVYGNNTEDTFEYIYKKILV